MTLLKNTILIIFLSYFASCQENAGTNIAPALRECYNNTRYVTRDYRLPSTINTLVEIIRKIEESNTVENARELSYQILHRFRQDGIGKNVKIVDSSQGLPYSPFRWEAYKNRVQLTQITPGNALNFNNDSLTALEACSLHFMISSTIETHLREDESMCNTIARYTSRVQKRDADEFGEVDGTSKSSCPIESGVVYTKWGAIKAGLVIAGIASGYEPNPVPVDNNNEVESEYASTIAGELSESALNQLSSTKTVGNKGGWNSTVEPKYYFLEDSDKENLYLTDAEIRGGLDGLFLALNIQNWKSKANNIKISQILDLYYNRGVFNDTSRACNRKNLIKDLINDKKIEQQAISFSKLLDKTSQFRYSLNEENVPQMIESATNSLRKYLNNDLKDLECSADNSLVEHVSAEVLIFIDMDWNYQIIQPLLWYILENIEVNKYESSYTIFDGVNCDIIVNKSRSILDFYEQFNITQKDKYPKGFNYNKVITMAENIFKEKLNNATDLTGQSTVILMLPHNTPNTSASDYVKAKRDDFKLVLPDVRIIVGGSGSKMLYSDLVTNLNSDIFTIPEDTTDTQIKNTGSDIVDRLKKIPRNIVNPACGSSFNSDISHNFQLTQYVEPSGINYHKISPNYFYQGQTLKIQGQGFGSLTVCISRTDINPKENATQTPCKNITSDEMAIDISSYCTDEAAIDCSPIYISVQGKSSNIQCTDNKNCRFPDNIKYTVSLENVHCSRSTKNLITSFLLIFLLFAGKGF